MAFELPSITSTHELGEFKVHVLGETTLFIDLLARTSALDDAEVPFSYSNAMPAVAGKSEPGKCCR